MNTRILRTLLVGWTIFGLVSADSLHAAAAHGTISGRVSNAGTGAYLDGAQVTLQPTGRTVETSRAGEYVFNQVPTGNYQIAVVYTGLEPGSAPVSVSAGATVTQDFPLTSSIYRLGEFVVSGEREGTSRAIQLQRHAPNVKNILSSDAFGSIADDNIGNFMRRLPGITISDAEGAPRTVNIRGMPGNLNSITIDGTRGANGRTTGAAASGEARAFDIDTFSAESIETIEVTKAPTPDMDADSVGGSVNLVTKSALDRKGRSFSYRLASTFNVQRETFRPAMNFSYSDRIGPEQRLGIMVTGSFIQMIKSRDNYRLEHESTTETDRTAFWILGQVNEDGLTYDRKGVSVRLDYRLAANSTIFFSSQYNDNADTLRRHRVLFGPNPTNIPAQVFTRYDAGGVARTATNAVARIFPGWTVDRIETINSTYTVDQNHRNAGVETLGFLAGGETRFAAAKLDYNVSHSRSTGYNDRKIMGTQVANVGFRFERKPENWGGFAGYEQISGPDVSNWANRRVSSYNLQNDTKVDEVTGAQLNFRKDLDLPVPTYFKTGFRIRAQSREHDIERTNFTPASLAVMGSPQRFHDTEYTYAPFDGLIPNAGFLDPDKVAAERAANPALFPENVQTSTRNSLTSDFNAKEDVYATYFMGGTRIGRLNILGGLRVEETRVTGTGNAIYLSPEEIARRSAWVGTVTPDETRRRNLEEYGNSRTTDGKYRNVFPGVHFRYELTEGTLARASYSSGIGRPNFGSIVPRDSVSDINETVSSTNPNLRPQYVDNFDLSLEHYFEPAGMVSVGVFLKEMNDFIFRATGLTIGAGPDNGFNGDYEGYELSTWANGGGARVRGLELSYQQQFSFLPGFWRGFGAFGNFTWLQSAGDFGTLGTAGFLPGFADESGTLGLTYTDLGWTIRLLGTYEAEKPGTIPADPSQQNIARAKWNVDLNTKYNINRWFSIFCDVRNLTNEHSGNSYKYTPSRQFQFQRFSTEISFGVSGRF